MIHVDINPTKRSKTLQRGDRLAYVDQDKKSRIAAELKKVVPAGWKYSLAMRNHSSIVMTIAQAPVDLLGQAQRHKERKIGTYSKVNAYSVAEVFGEDHPLVAIRDALNLDNNDGHYISIKVGKWDKPFVCTARPQTEREALDEAIDAIAAAA